MLDLIREIITRPRRGTPLIGHLLHVSDWDIEQTYLFLMWCYENRVKPNDWLDGIRKSVPLGNKGRTLPLNMTIKLWVIVWAAQVEHRDEHTLPLEGKTFYYLTLSWLSCCSVYKSYTCFFLIQLNHESPRGSRTRPFLRWVNFLFFEREAQSVFELCPHPVLRFCLIQFAMPTSRARGRPWPTWSRWETVSRTTLPKLRSLLWECGRISQRLSSGRTSSKSLNHSLLIKDGRRVLASPHIGHLL